RVAEVAALMNDAGLVVITAFISPYQADRASARKIIGPERFLEVFLDAPLSVCESRDPKGFYKKARAGEIPNFTGIASPYEAPETPDLVIQTGQVTVESAVDLISRAMAERSAVVPMEEACGVAIAD
ncbi:MAG TPA: adenylyl-sulfate kinase, partial [Rhodocyclaceae bacterium]|nr:adenylyl-sulfate kinase [Rhodocyclaceae bacterium]